MRTAARCARWAALLLGSLAATAHAQPAPPASAEPDALTTLGSAVAARARELGEGDGRWCLRLTTEAGAPETERALRSALAASIAAPLAGHAPALHVVGFRGEGREAAAVAARLGYDVLLDVRFVRRGSAVGVTSALYEGGEARGRWTEELPLDPRVRARLGWMPSLLTAEAVESRSGPLSGSGYRAMAVVDLDGDGRGELVTVSARGVRVFSVEPYSHPRRGRRLRSRLRAEASWPEDLAPPPSRRRRTVATAHVDDGTVLVRTSEHAEPLRVRWVEGALTLEPATDCAGFPVDAGCAALVEGRDFFDETFPGSPAAAGHFYTHRRRSFSDREGERRSFDARITTAGRLSVRVTDPARERPRASVAVGYGVALAMSDLDLDGSPELLASHASASDAPDQLTLLRVRASGRGRLDVLWRSEPTRGPVWTAAAGDVDGDGLEELLAIEAPEHGRRGRSRLWMVR